jgi:hypothetical protein
LNFKFFQISNFSEFQIFFEFANFFFSWQPRVGLSLHRRWGLSALTLGVISTDAGAVRTNAGAASTDAGAVSTNAGAASTDAGAVSTNAGAVSTKAGAVSTNAGAVSTNAGAASTHAGASQIFSPFFLLTSNFKFSPFFSTLDF